MELPPPLYEYRVMAMSEYQQKDVSQDLTERVRKAFDDVRHRDLQGVSKLQELGDAVVPLLKPYLMDSDEGVRREAVSLLNVIAGDDALALLILALADSSAEICDKAALALYQKFKPSVVAEQEALSPALIRLIQSESPPAAGLLLASYFPNDEMDDALQKAMKRTQVVEVKLFDHSTPVPVTLPIQIALAHHGSPEAMAALVRSIDNASVAEAEFILDAVQEADSTAVIAAVARYLNDTRQSTTLAHSAPSIRLRVCDLAVNALIKRFDLKVSFKHSKLAQYDNDQIEEVRRWVEKRVPDRPVSELVKPK